MSGASEAPRVYAAIAAVTRSLSNRGVPKRRTNAESGYAFRGVDDVMGALSPLLARHRLCMLPRMLERGCVMHHGPGQELLFSVWVRAAFDFVSAVDGSSHSIETFGEASDTGDKGTNKAMSAAFKYAALQSFCIPVFTDDADATTPLRLSASDQLPVEGWAPWVRDLLIVIQASQTHEALDRIQAVHRDRLRLLSKTEPKLYTEIGDAIGERRAGLGLHRSRAA